MNTVQMATYALRLIAALRFFSGVRSASIPYHITYHLKIKNPNKSGLSDDP